MRYDVLAESLRLIEGAPPASTTRLSRRVRHLALGVDRDGEIAATLFLRRGVNGFPLLDVHALELTGEGWRVLGGGGGPGDEASGPRPRFADLGLPAVSDGHGATVRSNHQPGRFEQWVNWTTMRAVAEVAVLVVGTRQVSVPAHGMAVLVWRHEPPQVSALDATGSLIGPVTLARSDSPAEMYRDG